MRKFKILLIFCCLFFIAFQSSVVLADDEIEEFNLQELEESFLAVSARPENIPTINSRAAVVIDRDSKIVLFGKEEKTPRPMASTTKTMTCIVVLENSNLEDIVEVSKKAGNTGGSRLRSKSRR